MGTPASFVAGTVLHALSLGALARLVAPDDFGVFVYAMRVAVLATLLGSLGTEWLVGREVARQGGAGLRAAVGQALRIVAVSWAALLLVVAVAREGLATLFFGPHAAGDVLVIAVLAGVGGTAVNISSYSLRSLGKVRRANLLHLSYFVIFGSLVGLLAVLEAIGRPLEDRLAILVLIAVPAVLLVGTSTAALWPEWLRHRGGGPRPARGQGLRYSMARTMSQLAFASIFMVPLAMAAHRPDEAAFVAMAAFISLIRLVEPLGNGIGVAIFPSASRRRPDEHPVWAQGITSGALFLASVVGTALLVSGPWAARLWFGFGMDLVGPAQLALLAAGAYAATLVIAAVLSGTGDERWVAGSAIMGLASAMLAASAGLAPPWVLGLGLVLPFIVLLARWTTRTGRVHGGMWREAAPLAILVFFATAAVLAFDAQAIHVRLAIGLAAATAAGVAWLALGHRPPGWLMDGPPPASEASP